MIQIQLTVYKGSKRSNFLSILVNQKRQTWYYNIILIMAEMTPIESAGFWGDAHKYAFTTGEEQFVSEIAYIMTTLHEEGYNN